MFSTKLTRAAHRATASVSPAAALISTTSTPHCTARPASHQRRPSSSKASSCPPDDSAAKAASTAKASGDQQPSRTPPVSEAKATPKQTKGKAKAVSKRVTTAAGNKKAVEPVDQFAGLPSVDPIQGLRAEDLTISRFFSLYRPVNPATPIPPPSTPEAFSAVLTGRPQDAWANGNSAEGRPEDTTYALHNMFDALEKGTGNAEDEGVRWEIIHESSSNSPDGVKHLDGLPQRKGTLEELVAQFKPFRAPPPPQPFVEANEQLAVPKTSTRGRPKKKTFTATITVTESTYEDGQRTYSASSSPIVRLPEPRSSETAIREPTRSKQHFLMRMLQRQREYMAARPSPVSSVTPWPVRKAASAARQERMRSMFKTFKMFLISVKRQRKLKMKKHKYKKLMKRTRNLRRRIERS
ncbi:hypothetical protein LTR09_006621 [Extremus antarcticus]|uniref:Small ribosomal subunit protein mS38 n=1 Tax=Extremus antarcticus TaxID=702011 RepID=A0AAJ0DE89_9PEZI|nr:hypothetical protein LTR09_006621 [Extremus antarcticus]